MLFNKPLGLCSYVTAAAVGDKQALHVCGGVELDVISGAFLPLVASEWGLGPNKQFVLKPGKEHRNKWHEVTCRWNITRN